MLYHHNISSDAPSDCIVHYDDCISHCYLTRRRTLARRSVSASSTRPCTLLRVPVSSVCWCPHDHTYGMIMYASYHIGKAYILTSSYTYTYTCTYTHRYIDCYVQHTVAGGYVWRHRHDDDARYVMILWCYTAQGSCHVIEHTDIIPHANMTLVPLTSTLKSHRMPSSPRPWLI